MSINYGMTAWRSRGGKPGLAGSGFPCAQAPRRVLEVAVGDQLLGGQVKKNTCWPRALRALIAVGLAVLCCCAWSQTAASAAAAKWPTRPLRLLIGFPPGSVQDLSARAISESLARILGQPVLVENKSGASGTIAADQVARASDQHTFGVMNNSQLTIARLLNPSVPYDPATDLAPLALIGTTPLVLVVSADAAGTTPQEWLAWLRALGEKANYGSPGSGTPGHLGMELLKSRAGLRTLHVPYPGNPQIINAMLGGQLQAGLLPPGLAMQQVRSGKMKAIGVTSQQPSVLAQELHTLRDVGVTGAEIELWSALAGPASLPAPIRERLSAAVTQALQEADTRERLVNVGWQPAAASLAELRQRVRDDTKTFGTIISEGGIRAGH
jgi:tripartite-type tricarboxylate transporter receptor subunit TctC